MVSDKRKSFNQNGYYFSPGLVPELDLVPLRSALTQLVENSRQLSKSDGVYDIDPTHCHENPRLRRIAYLDDLDPVFWEFSKNSIVTDLAAELLGPDITFRECIINFKWADGGQEVKWHQDIPFYPHTNLDTAQFLIFLDEVGEDQGPLQVIPGSHRGQVYDHYDDAENWLGYISSSEINKVPLNQAKQLIGPAGSVSAHHCVTVHGSKPNLSAKGRPALILGFNAADSIPYTPAAYPSSHVGEVVRGQPAKFARHDPINLRLPPDWSGGYTSIFSHQEKLESVEN